MAPSEIWIVTIRHRQLIFTVEQEAWDEYKSWQTLPNEMPYIAPPQRYVLPPIKVRSRKK